MRILLLLLFAQAAQVQAQVILPDHYTWRAGDDLTAAQPNFDDSAWQRVPIGEAPPRAAGEAGWLRFRLKAPPEARGKPLGLYFGKPGMGVGLAEIYLDGRLVHRLGQPGPTASKERPHKDQNPGWMVLGDPGPDGVYVLTVRYSDHFRSGPAWTILKPNFSLLIGDLDVFWRHRMTVISEATKHQMALTGIFMIFALLHLLLFHYHRDMRANLYFGLMVAALAVMSYARYEYYFMTDPRLEIWQERALWVAFPFSGLMMMGFVYSLFQHPKGRVYGLMSLACVGQIAWNLMVPRQEMMIMLVFISVALLDVARVIGAAWVHRRDQLPRGIWMIAVGALPMIVTGGHKTLQSLNLLTTDLFDPGIPAVMYAAVVLMLSMSIFLAREFGRAALNLEVQLGQVKVLSEKNLAQQVARAELDAEHRSKTHELEEARELQLSMLPKKLPHVQGFDLAVYMKPATEVGGDYYDFHQCDSGALVAAVGDATGHGLKAGTMVAATKSLFKSLAELPHQPDLLNRASGALKQMGFKGMFMALIVLRLEGNRVAMSAAGMPFAYLYRAASGEVQEQVLKGIPLGGPVQFPYPVARFEMEPGDTLLLLSDGLPERFNPSDQMFGDQRTRELFAKAAPSSAQAIIDTLVAGGDAWAEGRPQDDDVTFLVMKKL